MEKINATGRKPRRDYNNNDEERTHDVCDTTDADIPSAKVPDGSYLGERDDPPHCQPASQIWHDGRNLTIITRLRNQREGHETPEGVVGVEMTCYPVPEISGRQHGEEVKSVSDVWGAKDKEDFSTVPLGILTKAVKNNSQTHMPSKGHRYHDLVYRSDDGIEELRISSPTSTDFDNSAKNL